MTHAIPQPTFYTLKAAMMAGVAAMLVMTAPVHAQDGQTVVTTTSSHVMMTTSVAGPDNMDMHAMHEMAAMETPDADMQALLDTYKSLKPRAIEILNAKQARKEPTMADAVAKLAKKEHIKLMGMKGIKHDDSSFTNSRGETLDVDMYYTPMKGAMAKNRPIILYFHGGGFVIANREVYASSIAALARKTGAIVVAPEYRQAPENRFPAAHEDAFSAYYWTVHMAKKFGGDPTRIAVVGESAGGNLAANVAIMARDNSLQPPVALGLIYPMAGTNMDTPSYKQNAFAMPLNKAMMSWFMANMIRPESRAAEMHNPKLDLIHANLLGLPQTTLITAGIDPLNSDGRMLANELKAVNVPVHYVNYTGVTHEFFGADAVVAKAKEAQDMLASDLVAAFNKK